METHYPLNIGGITVDVYFILVPGVMKGSLIFLYYSGHSLRILLLCFHYARRAGTKVLTLFGISKDKGQSRPVILLNIALTGRPVAQIKHTLAKGGSIKNVPTKKINDKLFWR